MPLLKFLFNIRERGEEERERERQLLRERSYGKLVQKTFRYGVSLMGMPGTFAGQFANEERLTGTIFSETEDYFLNE